MISPFAEGLARFSRTFPKVRASVGALREHPGGASSLLVSFQMGRHLGLSISRAIVDNRGTCRGLWAARSFRGTQRVAQLGAYKNIWPICQLGASARPWAPLSLELGTSNHVLVQRFAGCADAELSRGFSGRIQREGHGEGAANPCLNRQENEGRRESPGRRARLVLVAAPAPAPATATATATAPTTATYQAT
jgi:hypothetical protein